MTLFGILAILIGLGICLKLACKCSGSCKNYWYQNRCAKNEPKQDECGEHHNHHHHHVACGYHYHCCTGGSFSKALWSILWLVIVFKLFCFGFSALSGSKFKTYAICNYASVKIDENGIEIKRSDENGDKKSDSPTSAGK